MKDTLSLSKPNIYWPFGTSFLFLVPMTLALAYTGQPDVAIACFVCFLTSISTHYYKCENKMIRTIDIIIVNAIGVYYTFHSAFKMGLNAYTFFVYFFGILALIIYFLFRVLSFESIEPEKVKNCHSFVHLFANLGIVSYVYARYYIQIQSN